MWKCTCELTGVAQLMFGRAVTSQKKTDETHDMFEERTWQEKVPVTPEGQVYITPFALKNALESAGRWRSDKIAGEGKKTFTKRFVCGVLITDRLLLVKPDGQPATMADVTPVRLFVPSDGKRGGPKRVFRIFPTIERWHTTAVVHVFDDKISLDVMRDHLVTCGQFVGFGAMRVENGGINGRYCVHSVEQLPMEAAA